MRIAVISEGYPYIGAPVYTFVAKLCNELASQGHKITVVGLQWLSDRLLRNRIIPTFRKEGEHGKEVYVYSPIVQGFGNISFLKDISEKYQSWKVCRILEKLPERPEAIYGHFWNNAYLAFPFAKKHGIPMFVASGEAEIFFLPDTPKKKKFAEYVRGVICVSSKNKRESIEKGLTIEEKCKVFPNSIDNKVFRKLDKQECRKKLGIKKDEFVCVFVGRFVDRKGPNRVSEAITLLNDKNIKSIFIGTNLEKTNVPPTCDGIIFKGALKHDMVAEYLNAADVFVLPTLHEGCCNAIVEAMACGLPIVSSDRDFNYDILDSSNSIMIDPMNVNEIAKAIKTLKDDETLRLSMSESSFIKAKELNITNRAKGIADFINYKLK